MNEKRKAYEEKLDAQLEEWNAQIALLKARDSNMPADIIERAINKAVGGGDESPDRRLVVWAVAELVHGSYRVTEVRVTPTWVAPSTYRILPAQATADEPSVYTAGTRTDPWAGVACRPDATADVGEAGHRPSVEVRHCPATVGR